MAAVEPMTYYICDVAYKRENEIRNFFPIGGMQQFELELLSTKKVHILRLIKPLWHERSCYGRLKRHFDLNLTLQTFVD